MFLSFGVSGGFSYANRRTDTDIPVPNLVMEVFALYPRNRVVRILVGALYIIDLIGMCTGMIGLPKLDYDGLCSMTRLNEVSLLGT